jgi:hypothetical protein
MTMEPTTNGPDGAPTTPNAEAGSESAPSTPTESGTSSEAAEPKVTRARVKTSGAASGGRAKAGTKVAATSKAGKAAAASPAATLKPAAPLVPVPMALSETGIVRADRIEISQGGAERVEATSVSVTQGGIGSADARTIDIRQGGIGRASATDIAVSQGSIGYARGERVSVEMGAVGAAIGDEVRVTQAMSGFVAAQGEAIVDQSLISTLIADRVTIRQPSAVLLLIARQVDGTVRPLLDWRGALAAGAVAGIVLGLLRMGRR